MGLDAGVPPGLFERIRRMVADEVAQLLRSGFLRNASITGGGMTIRGGFLRLRAADTEVNTFYVGPINPNLPDGSPQPGMVVRRNDGTVALVMWDPIPAAGDYNQFLAWYDRTGNIVFSDDTDSGQGIARPYLPIPLYPGLSVTALPASTTSTAFTALLIARTPKQQPRLFVNVLAGAPAGTTGEVRLSVDGTQLGAPVSVAGGTTLADVTFGPVAVAGGHMSELRIDVEARVVSGAGPVRLIPVRAEGRQS